MQVGSLFENTSLYTIQSESLKTQEAKSGTSLFSNQQDSVTISTEARARMEAEAQETKARIEATQAAEDAKKKEEEAAAWFGEYMQKAKGNVSESADSPEEKLEALKKKLEQLQDQKSKIATSESTPESVKEPQMKAIDAEIEQIMTQISELASMIGKKAAA